jgi:hypothetical protein
LTKHVHDDLKCTLSVDAVKVEVTPVAPALLDKSLVITAPGIVVKTEKVRMEKAKMTPKKSRLDKATSHLYDLEDSHAPEKCLNIDLGLYQMEDF